MAAGRALREAPAQAVQSVPDQRGTARVAEQAGRDFVPAPDTNFARLREAGLDVVGDLVASHLDTAALSRLIGAGPPSGLPVLPPAGPPAGKEPDGSR